MSNKNGADPALKTLEEIYRLFDRAKEKLVKIIGVPICIPNCGKCCEVNNITCKGVEARYAALWVMKQKPEFQKRIIDICESWLLEKDDKLGTYYGLGTSGMDSKVLDQVRGEALYISLKLPCPFLTEDKKCLIYPVRPMACRAYGVTRIVSQDVCPRPPGKKETPVYRAFLRDEHVDKIKHKIEQLKEEAKDKYIENAGYIVTLLYMELRPQKFVNHAYFNTIPSARMFQFGGGFILWQEQIEELADRETEIRMLVNPTV